MKRCFWAFVLVFLITSCQSPCSRSLEQGYSRFTPGKDSGFQIQFDYPSEWKLFNDGQALGYLGLSYTKPGMQRPSISIVIFLEDLEKNPDALAEDTQWMLDLIEKSGKADPNLVYSEQDTFIDAYRFKKISLEYSVPYHFLDRAPLNELIHYDSGYLSMDDTLYKMRFTASGDVDKADTKVKFNRLIDSICIVR